MIIIDLFDIDIHIFTVIKFLFNLVVKFKYKRVVEVTIHTTWILIPKVINVYEKRRFIFLIVDDILCKW